MKTLGTFDGSGFFHFSFFFMIFASRISLSLASCEANKKNSFCRFLPFPPVFLGFSTQWRGVALASRGVC